MGTGKWPQILKMGHLNYLQLIGARCFIFVLVLFYLSDFWWKDHCTAHFVLVCNRYIEYADYSLLNGCPMTVAIRFWKDVVVAALTVILISVENLAADFTHSVRLLPPPQTVMGGYVFASVGTVGRTTSWCQFKSNCHQTWSVIPLATRDEGIKFWRAKGQGRWGRY